jgi:hypothetical protein
LQIPRERQATASAFRVVVLANLALYLRGQNHSSGFFL